LAEFRNVQQLAHPSYEVFVSDEHLDYWKCVMAGPKRECVGELASVYEGACYELEISFPDNYPDEAPCVRFVTPIMHCNVNPYGRICHSLLTRAYTRTVQVSQILDCIYGLLLVPDVDDPIDGILAALYHSDRTAYETRVLASVREHASESLTKMVRRIRCGMTLQQ
jgi:ubiquitin-protein ligase